MPDENTDEPEPELEPAPAPKPGKQRSAEIRRVNIGVHVAAQIALARSWKVECAKIGPRVLIETVSPMPTATRGRFFPGEDRATLADPRDEASRLLALLQRA